MKLVDSKTRSQRLPPRWKQSLDVLHCLAIRPLASAIRSDPFSWLLSGTYKVLTRWALYSSGWSSYTFTPYTRAGHSTPLPFSPSQHSLVPTHASSRTPYTIIMPSTRAVLLLALGATAAFAAPVTSSTSSKADTKPVSNTKTDKPATSPRVATSERAPAARVADKAVPRVKDPLKSEIKALKHEVKHELHDVKRLENKVKGVERKRPSLSIKTGKQTSGSKSALSTGRTPKTGKSALSSGRRTPPQRRRRLSRLLRSRRPQSRRLPPSPSRVPLTASCPTSACARRKRAWPSGARGPSHRAD
ncbi:hypothetical protein CALVIDRAFT_139022 [Calocera viscosa TUFC12733]|uniref:Uncharacterized protein n=1 Tax=Calocera viscosa (strain TUFC12733) TaxID=1330018 RepID=A0A167M115_CALVF|nr:hypothetical protein CALVIDRAFT_139022 [Calocera viscosa TUFC12733]